MTNNDKSSYKQILKSTSIFGGVQAFNVIIQIFRSKIVAVLLGPTGMGFMGLLNSTLLLVSSMTNFGLARSAVREISQSNASEDKNKISHTISIFRKLVWITGILGFVVTILISPILSLTTFGNYNYTYTFIILAVTLLINQLAAGQTVLLQGMRKIKWLAKANVAGASVSLILTLPLYYYFRVNGIVPAIIVTSIVTLSVQYFYSKKIIIVKETTSFLSAIKNGNSMLKLGMVLSMSSLISVAASYLIRIYITNYGNISEVGLYTAGFAIINTYIGMVFTAMTTDYFPRLAAVNTDRSKYNKLINQQSEIAIYIIAPLICIFLVFINWIIILLYSEQFLPITGMLHWAIMGIYFKTLSWSIGIIIMAKGDGKYFFWNEFFANIYLLLLNILGYHFFGLTGLGLSFLVGYFLHFIQIFFFAKIKYNFKFQGEVLKIFFLNLIVGITCFILAYFSEGFMLYIGGSILILGVASFSFYKVNQKMNLLGFIKNKLKKNE